MAGDNEMSKLSFTVKKEKLSNEVTISITDVNGAIDATNVCEFEEKLLKILEGGIRNVVLIFSQLHYINSTAMGVLVKIGDRFLDQGGEVKLVDLPEKVRSLFDMLGLLSLFNCYNTEKDAIDSFFKKLVVSSLPSCLSTDEKNILDELSDSAETFLSQTTEAKNLEDSLLDSQNSKVISLDDSQTTESKNLEDSPSNNESKAINLEDSFNHYQVEEASIELSSKGVIRGKQRTSVTCPFCGELHKVIFYNRFDKYECPKENGIFGVEKDLSISIVELPSSNPDFFLRSVVEMEELLPIYNPRLNQESQYNTDRNVKDSTVENLNNTVIDPKAFSRIPKDIIQDNIDIRAMSRDRYDLISKLGSGSFGKVYKAFDRVLSKVVAIKVSNNELDDEECKIYENEAKVLAKLDHSNIVKVYNFGLSGKNNKKRAHIVMEYLEYSDFMHFIEEARRNNNTTDFMLFVAKSFLELADALKYLHDKNIFHMDIKPQNILISDEGNRPKFIDFGIVNTGGKKESLFRGNYRYAPLEKMIEDNFIPSENSDIYSLGAVFYECLTGRYANLGNNKHQIIANCLDPEKELFQMNDQVDRSLKYICERCLAPKSKNRYQKARDFHADLKRYIASYEIVDAPYLYFEESKKIKWFSRERSMPKKTVFPLKKLSFYIGRSFSNDLIILDKEISRVHVLVYLETEKQEVYIKNVSEKNIVKVGDKILAFQDEKKLSWNAKIIIGNRVFFYVPNSVGRKKAREAGERIDDFLMDQRIAESMSEIIKRPKKQTIDKKVLQKNLEKKKKAEALKGSEQFLAETVRIRKELNKEDFPSNLTVKVLKFFINLLEKKKGY